MPLTIRVEEAVRIAGEALTVGEERFRQADALMHAGKTAEAIRAFEQLRVEYPQTWIDRVAQERLAAMSGR